MSDNSLRAGTPGKFGAWIRYGGDPISEEQLAFAAQNYAVAILQPWEQEPRIKLVKLGPGSKSIPEARGQRLRALVLLAQL